MPKINERIHKRVLIAAVGLALCQLGGFVLATPGATRRLLEDAGQTKFRVADFSGLSEGLNETEVQLPETQLSGAVSVSGNGAGVALYGSYPLGAAQVRQLAKAISDEVDLVPPSQAAATPVVTFPGVTLRGESVLDTLSAQRPQRIPTVFAPFHAGAVFKLEGRPAPPGVTLSFSNMTLLLPNVTFDGIYDSGFMDFFDLGRSARICFTNTILALRSCKGYRPDLYHMWCCTKQQCNILYTKQAIADLGYKIKYPLDFIQCASTANDGASAVAAAPAPAPAAPPLRIQEADTTSVRVANFTVLPPDLSAEVEVMLPEMQIAGTIDIARSTITSELYGTYYLSPDEVLQLVKTVADNMPLVPAAQAIKSPMVEFPGVFLRGESALDTLSPKQPLRIPTVFAPFHAGTVFQVQARESPPGVTLSFSNMTLLLPNVTYDGIYDSGFLDFFELGKAARICFSNSILVLQSCKGFKPDTYHMWCCTKRQCNILYTKQAIADLGYDTIDDLQFFQCFSSEQSGGPGAGMPGSALAPGATDGSSAADTEASQGDAGADGGGSTVQTPDTSVAGTNANFRAVWWAAAVFSVAAIAVASPC